jgi:hypothetical protein
MARYSFKYGNAQIIFGGFTDGNENIDSFQPQMNADGRRTKNFWLVRGMMVIGIPFLNHHSPA